MYRCSSVFEEEAVRQGGRFFARIDQTAPVLVLIRVLWASFTSRSTSALLRPLDAVIVIVCSFPVARSLAEMLTMPLASTSKIASNLQDGAWGGRDADQVKAAERAVVAGQRALGL
jgi:hypothetical protein